MSDAVTYHNYEVPITEMRQYTAKNTPFKIEFRKKDGGRRIIHRALLRNRSKSEYDHNWAYKLQLLDVDNEVMRSCYIPLILSLNDKKILVNGPSTPVKP